MKKLFTFSIALLFAGKITMAVNTDVPPFCSDPRYSTSEITSISGNYADPPNNTNNFYTFQIFYPSASVDTSKERPFVLYIHGGGFSSGSYKSEANKCQELARRGYVAATINYFVTPWQSPGCVSSDTIKLFNNIYQAIQDARAAMRYFAFHAADYGIDTSRLFIGGSSAGSITALLTAFLNQKEANKDLGKHPDLGSLDDGPNAIVQHFVIRGVTDLSGAVRYQSDIDKKEKIPVVSFHATDDPLVPYGINYFDYADCDSTFIIVAGSSAIYDRLSALKICAELNYKDAATHGGFDDDYVVRHTSCFFRSVWMNDCVTQQFNFADQIIPDCCGNHREEAPNPSALMIFPNPASDNLCFQIEGNDDQDCLVNIYSEEGFLISAERTDGSNRVNFATGNWPSGLYFYRIIRGKEIIHLGTVAIVH